MCVFVFMFASVFTCVCISLHASACEGHISERPPVCCPQLSDVLNHQFDSVCESVFGEAESQAVEALDLPGCFRTRSHSYVRAIQAGCSQDDDCLSVFSISSPKVGPKAAGGESHVPLSWSDLCACNRKVIGLNPILKSHISIGPSSKTLNLNSPTALY